MILQKTIKINNNISKSIFISYHLSLADTVDAMQKVTALLCENDPNVSLGDLEGKRQKYEVGGLYKFVNQPNIRVFCFTFDDIFSDRYTKEEGKWEILEACTKGSSVGNTKYKWHYICQNTSKVFLVFDDDGLDYTGKKMVILDRMEMNCENNPP